MQRRNFLKALALAAGATALIHAGPVVAAPHPHQKFIDALALFDNTIAVNKASKEVNDISFAMNELFAFMMANFAKPTPGDQEFTKQVLHLLETQSPESMDSRLRHVPPQIAEMIWPVAAAKALLSEHKTRVDARIMPAFSVFIKHYKEFIIA